MRRAAALLLAAALAGCGSGDARDEGGERAPRSDPESRANPEPVAPDRQPRTQCPANTPPGCQSAAGRVVYRELVDPDGDGDLHVVVAGGSITAPGFSTFDIAPALRPKRDPRIGDWVAASGPVYRGSYGQRQIEARVVRVAHR